MKEPTKGMLIPTEGIIAPVRFQWNPNKVGGPKTKASWTPIKTAGRHQPFLQYGAGESNRFSMSIQLSRYDNEDNYVADTVARIQLMQYPQIWGVGVARPPRVMLVMGTFLRRLVVIESVDPVFKELFNPDTLLPYDAEVALSLIEYTNGNPAMSLGGLGGMFL